MHEIASWVSGAPLDRADQWGATTKAWHVRAWSGWGDGRKLKALREISDRYGADPVLRELVVNQVIRGVPSRDYAAQVGAILAWIQANIYYVNEPDEQIQTPSYTLRKKFGDCDDMAVLGAAMLRAIMIPYKFVLAGRVGSGRYVRWIEGVGWKPRANFDHIYLAAGIMGPPARPGGKPAVRWISMEPTIKGAPLGWDVVLHGQQQSPQGGYVATIAPTHSVAVPGMHQISPPRGMPLDGFGGADGEPTLGDRIREALRPEHLIVGAIQGTISALILRALMSGITRRRSP